MRRLLAAYDIDELAGVVMGALALALTRVFTGLDRRAERERRRGTRQSAQLELPACDAAAQPARSNSTV